jgi:hypothetical protein
MHIWIIGLSILVMAGYIWHAIAHRQTEQQITVSTLLAAVLRAALKSTGKLPLAQARFLQPHAASSRGTVCGLRLPS